MIEFILDNLKMIATGATTALISFAIYTTTNRTFQSGGKFRSKEEAVFIVLGTLSFTGLLKPRIQVFWANTLSSISGLQLFGATLILGTLIANESVNYWNHFDLKSRLMHFVGITLLIFGKSIYYIPLT